MLVDKREASPLLVLTGGGGFAAAHVSASHWTVSPLRAELQNWVLLLLYRQCFGAEVTQKIGEG